MKAVKRLICYLNKPFRKKPKAAKRIKFLKQYKLKLNYFLEV